MVKEMKVINMYTGFEGEGEITFTQEDSGTELFQVNIWVGYFDSIIALIEPNQEGNWEGFALHYHCHTGWYKERWECDNLELFSKQLVSIDTSTLDEDAKFVLSSLRLILSKCLNSSSTLYIDYY
jgi:hypothetical protein